MRTTYNNLFGENFSWGASVRHIGSGVTGYIASVYDNGTVLMLAPGGVTRVGSIRVGEDFELRDAGAGE